MFLKRVNKFTGRRKALDFTVGTAWVSFTGRRCIVLLRVGAGLELNYKHLEDKVIWNRWSRESGNRSGSSWPLRMSRDAISAPNVGTGGLVVSRAWGVQPCEESRGGVRNTGPQPTYPTENRATASCSLPSWNYIALPTQMCRLPVFWYVNLCFPIYAEI